MQLGWECPGSGINKEPWKCVEGTGDSTEGDQRWIPGGIGLVGQSEGRAAGSGWSKRWCLKPEERFICRILQFLKCSCFADNITNVEGKDKRDSGFWWKNLRNGRKNKMKRKMNSNPRAQRLLLLQQ